MASEDEIATRWFVLLSNVFFLGPAAYAFYKSASNFNKILHGYLLVFIAVASTLWHLCSLEDEPSDVVNTCILPSEWLYFADFMISIAQIPNVLGYSPMKEHYWLRDLGLASVFLFGPFIQQTDLGWYIFSGVLLGWMLLARWLLRLYRPDAVHYQWPLVQEGRIIWWLPFVEGFWPWLFLGLFFGVAGLTFFILDGHYFYADFHPTWHLTIALSILFFFLWIDTMPPEPPSSSNTNERTYSYAYELPTLTHVQYAFPEDLSTITTSEPQVESNMYI